ncbi:MAG: PSD1 domain-containing protein [Bryobacterales bacterium]|nr:PSD1 domain-containing protein [Bryobacterales bacterium]
MLRPILLGLCCALGAFAEPVSFSREILPVLSEKCFGCHGQDEGGRKANLRLDTREGATAGHGGKAAVVPGDPVASRLMARIAPEKPALVMPPPYSHKAPLTAAEVKRFEQWIKEGAVWGKHWSFEQPVRPVVSDAGRAIEELVSKRLRREGMTLAGKASRETLARRLAFDLTGLPPDPALAGPFLQGGPVEAYVDALLASPHYGERMAMWWLDAARYSDTDGFQADDTRTNWPWRDWVVAAFNRNMPYDQFTIEQFAGDLLPQATAEQKLATAFHRNHMTNGEGGRDPEESRIDYVMDRVNTTGTVWLGLTLQCTQCHTHKFDPISHHDYYSLNAFFNSVDETGRAGKKADPYMEYASPQVERAIAEANALVDARKPVEAEQRRQAQPVFAKWLAEKRAALGASFDEWHYVRATSLQTAEGTELKQGADAVIATSGPDPRQDDYRIGAKPGLTRITGLRLEVFPDASYALGKYTRGGNGDFLLTDVKLQVRQDGNNQLRDIAVANAVADYSADKAKNNNYGLIKDTLDDDPRNGWTTIGAAVERHVAVFALAEPLVLAANEELIFEMRHRSTGGNANVARFRVSLTDARGPVLSTVGVSPLMRLARLQKGDALPADLRDDLEAQFLADYAPYQAAKQSLDRALAQLKEIESAKAVKVMVLADKPEPRDTHVLLRGIWDKKGDVVKPAVLPFLGEWPASEPRNRLGLARWLVSSSNPLTARVTANHIWQLLFGTGLVRTTEDFGLQGERPEHAELLDYLALELRDNGWNIKRLVRKIVLSEVYQQSSVATPALLAKDPENRLLARGPRFRLPSWMLRDAALHYAGLLNPALGGPPVRPYQPEGVWEELFMGRFKYEPSEGAAQYRRTLYAFWRRSIAPTFLFDSAQRRMCEVRQSRTNTPMHALTLLNDQTYLEASRVLAEQAMFRRPEDRVPYLFERVLTRKPGVKELAVLQREFERARTLYARQPGEAAKLVRVGQGSVDKPSAELSALMVVASMILNLDEAMTHE